MSGLFIQRDGIARAWSQFFADTPLVLSPTWAQLPFDLGFDVASPESIGATLEMMRPLVHANLLGLPSACVPVAQDAASGLPIGVLVTGARCREDLCLDAAQAIESTITLPTPIEPRTAG
jgi:amidase